MTKPAGPAAGTGTGPARRRAAGSVAFLPRLFAALALLGALGVLLVASGALWPNALFASGYPVHGIDVSNHQGTIDWDAVAADGTLAFAFLKATEGDDYRDAYFARNWAGAAKAGLLRGAYHYFTTGSSGAAQAANFLAVAPPEAGCLPPVVDLESAGAEPEAFRKELSDFLAAVESAYGTKPVLYTTYGFYGTYVAGAFDAYPLWIRDVVKPASLPDGRAWTFWQYGHRGHVPGIAGYVDLDVFAGTRAELEGMRVK